MRLAVLSRDKLQIFDGREEVVKYQVGDNLTEEIVEQARVGSYAQPPVIVRYPRFGLLGQPSPYTYGAA